MWQRTGYQDAPENNPEVSVAVRPAPVHVHGSGVWGNRYRCYWSAGVRRVAV